MTSIFGQPRTLAKYQPNKYSLAVTKRKEHFDEKIFWRFQTIPVPISKKMGNIYASGVFCVHSVFVN